MRSQASSKARWHALVLLPLVLLGLAVSAQSAPAAPVSKVASAISLPKDESPHPSTPQEWWYFNGHVSGIDPSGKLHQYGVLLSFIRRNPDNTAPASVLYDSIFAITDLTKGTFSSDMNEFATEPDNVLPQGGYNVTVNQDNARGINGQNTLTATIPDGSYGISLQAKQYQPFALHGNGGVIPYGPFGSSYYYSQTNLQTFGTLTDHGVPIRVTGVSWMDHQWGAFIPGSQGGWTWFSVQLANGTQYMFYFIVDANGNLAQTVATRINPGGSTVNLDPSQVSLTPLGKWTSPTTGYTYTQNWKVSLPGGAFTINALQQNQEPTIQTPAGVSGFWEGDSSVTGTVGGVPVFGTSYVEITPNFTMP
jgi:predicted secreted hydrolase